MEQIYALLKDFLGCVVGEEYLVTIYCASFYNEALLEAVQKVEILLDLGLNL